MSVVRVGIGIVVFDVVNFSHFHHLQNHGAIFVQIKDQVPLKWQIIVKNIENLLEPISQKSRNLCGSIMIHTCFKELISFKLGPVPDLESKTQCP